MCLYNSQNVLVYPCASVATTRNPHVCIGRSRLEEADRNIRRRSSWWRRAKFRFCAWGRQTLFGLGIPGKDDVARLKKLDKRGVRGTEERELTPKKGEEMVSESKEAECSGVGNPTVRLVEQEENEEMSPYMQPWL